MTNRLNNLEKRLQYLIEVHLVKYIPNPGLQDQIARLIAEALRTNISTRSLNQQGNTVPTEFLLVVHPGKMDYWKKYPELTEGLTNVIQLAASEMSISFSKPPTLNIIPDANLGMDQIDVQIIQPENLAETQNIQADEEELPLKKAFVIVGGINIFTLNQHVTSIGRRQDNLLVVDDPRVSRYHAQIRFIRNRFVIFDLNSTGGTYVNGLRTTRSVLYPGDVISLAGLPLVFGQDNPVSTTTKGDTVPLSPSSSDRNTLSFPKNTLDYSKPE